MIKMSGVRAMRGLCPLPLLAALAISVGLASSSWAAEPPCADVPVRVTILSNAVDPLTGVVTPAALRSDGLGEYVHGASKVSATIHVCDGTFDVILNVSSTKRTFAYQFNNPIAGSVIDSQPAWAPGTHKVSGWINIRNLLFSRQSFTTHMGTTFTAPDRGSYRIGFMPVTVDAPNRHPVSDNQNTPYESSPARVYPQPFDCNSGGTTKPSWVVLGNNPGDQGSIQVGTLNKLATTASGTSAHKGQYSLPFELRIEALQCFNY
jgi:hypothetical protein